MLIQGSPDCLYPPKAPGLGEPTDSYGPTYTVDQIVAAYEATVGAGKMTEAQFVEIAMTQYGVTVDQLVQAQQVLVAEQATAAGPSTVFVASDPVYTPSAPDYSKPAPQSPPPAIPPAPVYVNDPIVDSVVNAYLNDVVQLGMSEADFVAKARGFGVTDAQLVAARDRLVNNPSLVAQAQASAAAVRAGQTAAADAQAAAAAAARARAEQDAKNAAAAAAAAAAKAKAEAEAKAAAAAAAAAAARARAEQDAKNAAAAAAAQAAAAAAAIAKAEAERKAAVIKTLTTKATLSVQDVVDAYQLLVVHGQMTEAQFVAYMHSIGVSDQTLTEARNVIVALQKMPTTGATTSPVTVKPTTTAPAAAGGYGALLIAAAAAYLFGG